MKIKNKFFRKLINKKEKFEEKIRYKKSYKYYIFTCIFFVGYLFFFSSGYIFDTNRERKSTEIGVEINLTNSKITIISQQYNKNNGLLQVNLNVEKTNILFGNDILVSAIERADLNKNLDVKTIRLDDSQYVLLIKVPKKWTNVAIEIKEDGIENSSKAKLFIDENLCVRNDELVELSKVEYLIENVDTEIESINLDIESYKKEIEENNKKIVKTEEEIKKLEDNIKYEIESEATETTHKIETLKGDIKSLKASIEELNNQIEMLNKKINKLNEKKEDYKSQSQ